MIHKLINWNRGDIFKKKQQKARLAICPKKQKFNIDLKNGNVLKNPGPIFRFGFQVSRDIMKCSM